MSIKIPYKRKETSSTLLVFSAIALLLLASSPLLLSPFTMSVFAQTEADAGGDAATMASGANETTTAAASPARNNNMTGVTFLFIQHAQSGSVSEVNATTSTLELSDVSDKTIMFSDRPDRIVTSQSTSDFVGNWTMGEDSFAADPPNAVLILDDDDDEEQRQDIAVIELYNPEYDSEADTLRYDITAENATTTTSINLPSEFGRSTLVIDGGGAIVSGGDANTASGEQSVVSGGDANTASGEQSVVAPSGSGGGGSINNGQLDKPE